MLDGQTARSHRSISDLYPQYRWLSIRQYPTGISGSGNWQDETQTDSLGHIGWFQQVHPRLQIYLCSDRRTVQADLPGRLGYEWARETLRRKKAWTPCNWITGWEPALRRYLAHGTNRGNNRDSRRPDQSFWRKQRTGQRDSDACLLSHERQRNLWSSGIVDADHEDAVWGGSFISKHHRPNSIDYGTKPDGSVPLPGKTPWKPWTVCSWLYQPVRLGKQSARYPLRKKQG